MNKAKVVLQLVSAIKGRLSGHSPEQIEHKLLLEGWPLGAIREALDAAS